jgi:hypothetical protein
MTRGSLKALAPLRAYRREIARRFPDLDHDYIERSSLRDRDALLLVHLLDHLDETAILVHGSRFGAAEQFFASHPRVALVAGVHPDWHSQEVSRTVLPGFEDGQHKVRMKDGLREALEEVKGAPSLLLAFLGEPCGRTEVAGGLKAVFDAEPETLAVVAGCHAPSAPAGVADFMEGFDGEWRFVSAADLGPGAAASRLGFVHREGADAAERALTMLGADLTRRLDPLRLLAREEELLGRVHELSTRLEKAEEELRRRSPEPPPQPQRAPGTADRLTGLLSELLERGRPQSR